MPDRCYLCRVICYIRTFRAAESLSWREGLSLIFCRCSGRRPVRPFLFSAASPAPGPACLYALSPTPRGRPVPTLIFLRLFSPIPRKTASPACALSGRPVRTFSDAARPVHTHLRHRRPVHTHPRHRPACPGAYLPPSFFSHPAGNSFSSIRLNLPGRFPFVSSAAAASCIIW